MGAVRNVLCQERCAACHAVRLLRTPSDARQPDGGIGLRVKQRLYEALQAVHQRARSYHGARTAGSYQLHLLRVDYCHDLHDTPEYVPPAYHDLAFDARSPQRQGRCSASWPGLIRHKSRSRTSTATSAAAELLRNTSRRGMPGFRCPRRVGGHTLSGRRSTSNR